MGSSAVYNTFPSFNILTPVVPPPTSTTAPSIIPSAKAAAVGSSSIFTTSISQDSSTFPIVFAFPAIVPGGTAQEAHVIFSPNIFSTFALRILTVSTAPIKSTTSPSLTTDDGLVAPAIGLSNSSTTEITIFAVPRSTPAF